MTDKFESYNRLAEQQQQYPMLSGQDLEDKFRQVDRLLEKGIRVLLDNTHFVEDNLCYRLAEIVIGSIKAKIYRGLYVTERRGAGQGITVGAQNSKILASGFDLFKLSRTPRDIAVPLVLRVLRSLRLQNINYEQILRAFDVLTKDYRSICEEMTLQQQRLKLAEENNTSDLVDRMQAISDLIDQKTVIESRVGCMEPNTLYGAVAMIHRFLLQVDRIQTEIIQAYLRSIPRIVREFAKSDLDAHDIHQAGSIGLMHAVKAYDFRSRAGFARFSRAWIRQRIRAFMKESGGPAVRLPPNVWEDHQKYQRAERTLSARNPGRQIMRSDVATELGWSIDKVDSVIEKIGMCQIDNLDDELPTDTDEYLEREATIADTREEDFELFQQRQEQVSSIVQNLSPEDRHLICLRFGCVELIENDQLDAHEVMEEFFRQLACRTLVHQYMAGSIDIIHSMPLGDDSDASL